MATKLNLTDRTVRSLIKKARKGAAATGDYLESDFTGFGIRVTPNGHTNWQLIARYPGSPKGYPARRTLGDVHIPPEKEKGAQSEPPTEMRNGALTLAEARDKARRWRDLIARGIDPKIERDRERHENLRRQSNTFRAMAESFLDRYVKGTSYCELEKKADELRKLKPDLKLDKKQALRRVLRDPANAELVERTKHEGLVKKGEAERIIGRFTSRWGSLNPADITPFDAAEAIRAIRDKHGTYEAYNSHGTLNRLYSWAIGTGAYAISRPVTEALSPRDIIGKREPRIRVLTDNELRAVWQASGDLGYSGTQLMRLLILTGQRLNEVAGMSWPEIDFGKKLWTIPADRMKADRGHEVPLAPDALAILKALDELRRKPPKQGERREGETLPLWDKGEFIFSSSRGARPVSGFAALKRLLDAKVERVRAEIAREAGEALKPLPRWTNHDLRRTARTHFSALPVQDMVRELAIAHAKSGLHKIYDQHSYQDEKRELFMLWEKRLGIIVNPKPAGVADLDKARAKRRSKGAA